MTKRRAICRPHEHTDVPLRGGKRVRCTRCGDVFPCRHDCEHYDCIVATGRKLPDHVEVRDA